MSERRALYLTIAHRSVEQGDVARAIVTIVNALRNNPQFLETQPEAVDFLAEILVPGFEEEIHRLEALYPSFGYRLYDALAAHGRAEYAHDLEMSFGVYCIEQMKTVLSASERHPHAVHDESVRYRDCYDVREVSYCKTVMGSGLYRSVEGDAPWRRNVTNGEVCDRNPQIMNDDAYAQALTPIADDTRASRNVVQNVQSHAGVAISSAMHTAVQREAAVPSSMYRAIRKPPEPVVVSHDLPPEVWMPSIRESDKFGQTTYEKHEFSSQNIDTCSAEGVRRFDRIRTQPLRASEKKPEPEAFIDTGVDRVILDFDNCIRQNANTALFAATKTPFKSYEEEAAEWRELTRNIPVVHREPVQNPLELVAETTHALSDTPSVEPYSVRHPLRFHLTPQTIFTCVFVCLFGVLGVISWKTFEPRLEKKAIESYSQLYLQATENGGLASAQNLDFPKKPFLDTSWISGYRQFLNAWQNRFYRDPQPYLSPDDPSFEAQWSAAHAGYITQEIDRGHLARARAHFQSVATQIWRDHPYFKTWSEAQIQAASGDRRAAALKYEKLLRTPLAPYAITELGLLAVTDSTGEIQHRWQNDFERVDTVPQIARCLHDAILRTGTLSPSNAKISELRTPYAEYCLIGNIFRSIHDKKLISQKDIQALENASMTDAGESLRLEAIIDASLYMRDSEKAIRAFQELELPNEHPVRQKLLRAILNRTQATGDWHSLNLLVPTIPPQINTLSAARIIDSNLQNTAISRSENLLTYGKTQNPATDAETLDAAYFQAIAGKFDRALSLTRSLLSSHPEHLEPLYLQAMILSASGKNEEAATVLEQALYSGVQAAPLIVLSNLYRARANMALNAASPLLRWMHFDDASLESARCEIFWHTQSSTQCLDRIDLNQNPQKSAWIMRHLDADGTPNGSSAQWAKANAGYLSFPGYHLAYARTLDREDAFSQAITAYTHAILDDASTATPDVVEEFARAYTQRLRRNEGARKFESLIEIAEKRRLPPNLIGTLHLQTALLYQPESTRSKVRRHLSSAIDYLGEKPEILRAYVTYYEAKNKPEQARIWRFKLRQAEIVQKGTTP